MTTANLVLGAGGVSVSAVFPRPSTGQIGQAPILPKADAGSLTTRTGDTVGTITMDDAGHPVATADVIDVYWAGGIRYGCTVGTVSGTSVPITGGAGDVLPDESTVLTVGIQQEIDVDFDGDKLTAIVLGADKRCHFDFVDSGAASLAAAEIVAGEAWFWIKDTGPANPLTGNPVDAMLVSNGDSAATAQVKLALVYDSTI